MNETLRPNRLARESSPYLRQHAGNPVDWFPWGAEAFEAARRLDRPVFLSIGYSSCHWCHVMAHESFEDEEVAACLNGSFVSVKVDREERPDVDEIYMTACQVTTGHGGWPLSAFLFPDGRPFFAGTYFPKEDRRGRPGFLTLLSRIAEAWRDGRGELEETAAQIAEAVAGASDAAGREAPRPLGAAALAALLAALRRSFDERHGGFGGAPKFPPHGALAFLLLRAKDGDAEALALATRTLEAMALGGIHDHLGGGFHRYSTDGRWLVPHFEKMLTDNGQLLAAYANAWALTRRPLFRRTAEGIAEYLLREMRGPEGAFFAATDADSEGEEGKFFVFSAGEIEEALGAADARFFGEAYGVRPEGNWHEEATGEPTGTNILHLAAEPRDADERRLAPMRRALLTRRGCRVPPGLDDKRISGWNALALSGLVAAARALGEPRYLETDRSLAAFLGKTMRDGGGRLLRSWKEGAPGVPAFLEDEAYLANALLDLADAEAAEERESERAAAALDAARAAVASLRRRFRRPGAAGFTFSGEGHERLLAPVRDLFDKATPSGSASAALALIRLARRTGDAALAAEARDALAEVSGLMARAPHGTETWHLVLAELLAFEAEFGAPPEATGAAAGPVTLSTAAAPVRIAPGGARELALAVGIAEGWHLEADGLAVEASAGSGLAVGPPALSPPSGGRYEREVGVRIGVAAPRPAVAGDWLVAVTVRFRACGEGSCQPERALSLAIPVRVG